MNTLLSLSLMASAKEFSYAFRNFLDEFYAHPDAARLAEAPQGEDPIRNAYLAATGDFLCNKYQLGKPLWLTPAEEGEKYTVNPPYFASTYWKTRIWLLVDSPQEFRQRNLFVGADALSRT